MPLGRVRLSRELKNLLGQLTTLYQTSRSCVMDSKKRILKIIGSGQKNILILNLLKESLKL
jgi:hypothetical protein